MFFLTGAGVLAAFSGQGISGQGTGVRDLARQTQVLLNKLPVFDCKAIEESGECRRDSDFEIQLIDKLQELMSPQALKKINDLIKEKKLHICMVNPNQISDPSLHGLMCKDGRVSTCVNDLYPTLTGRVEQSLSLGHFIVLLSSEADLLTVAGHEMYHVIQQSWTKDKKEFIREIIEPIKEVIEALIKRRELCEKHGKGDKFYLSRHIEDMMKLSKPIEDHPLEVLQEVGPFLFNMINGFGQDVVRRVGFTDVPPYKLRKTISGIDPNIANKRLKDLYRQYQNHRESEVLNEIAEIEITKADIKLLQAAIKLEKTELQLEKIEL